MVKSTKTNHFIIIPLSRGYGHGIKKTRYHGIKKTRYDRCLRPPSRIEPSMRVKLKSKRRSPVCIQLISCTVLKREICYV